jgi:hypothetical protein
MYRNDGRVGNCGSASTEYGLQFEIETMKVGGPVSNKKGWDALYSLTESLCFSYYLATYLIVADKI